MWDVALTVERGEGGVKKTTTACLGANLTRRRSRPDVKNALEHADHLAGVEQTGVHFPSRCRRRVQQTGRQADSQVVGVHLIQHRLARYPLQVVQQVQQDFLQVK